MVDNEFSAERAQVECDGLPNSAGGPSHDGYSVLEWLWLRKRRRRAWDLDLIF